MPKSKAKKRAEEEPRAKHKTENWVIVHNPWYASHNRRDARLSVKYLQDIAWWLQIMFGARKVQTIQHKTNHNHIIVKLDLDVDIVPNLGRHDWATFLRGATTYQEREYSKIYEYNFVKYGDQSDKGWVEYLPLPRPHPHDFPIKLPYPAPVWCERASLSWALPIEFPDPAFVNIRPDEIATNMPPLPVGEDQQTKPPFTPLEQAIQFTNPGTHVHQSQTPAAANPLCFSPSISAASAGQVPVVSRLLEVGESTRTTDPRIRSPALQSATSSAIFRPYEKPAHFPLQPLTLLDHDEGISKNLASIAVPQDNTPIKREPSPIRVPYPLLLPEEEEKKVKRDPSPIRVPYPDTKYTPSDEKVKHSTSPLGVPSKKYDLSVTPPPALMNQGPQVDSVEWPAPNGDIVETRLVLIQNPLGIQFPPPGHNSLPDVVETWDWLELIADGALALYFDWKSSHNDNWVVARIRQFVDLNGILGHHKWGQILANCPLEQSDEVSTITLYLTDPDSQDLRRLDAPEVREDYARFCVPYPAPLPLDNCSVNGTIIKRQCDHETEDWRKRIKF